MIRFIILLAAFYLVNLGFAYAQILAPAKGLVEVIQDEKITQLASKYTKMSLNNPEIDGFRVQVYFDSGTNSKSKATIIKSEFEASHPGVKSYLSYKEPYYRIRVGDFRTLIEAVGFQRSITNDYPNSYPVKDKINP